jgi:hypothetical protein
MDSKTRDAMRKYVIDQHIETGKHLFVSDVAKQFNTNALGVRNALGYDDFVFEEDSRWSGSNFAGRYIQAACVTPARSLLIRIIRSLRA